MQWHSDCLLKSNPQPKQPSTSQPTISDSLSKLDTYAGLASLMDFMGGDGEPSPSMAAVDLDDRPPQGDDVYEYHPAGF